MQTPLFEAFSPADEALWIERIKKELKGLDFEQLQKDTYEQITLKPFYTANDLPKQMNWGNGKTTQGWDNCLKMNNLANIKLQNLQMKGVDAVYLAPSGTAKVEDIITFVEGANTSQISIILDLAQNLITWVEALEVYHFKQLYLCYESQKIGQEWVKLLKNKNITGFLIQGLEWNNAGANAVQELAFSLAKAVEFVHQTSELGLAPADILAKIGFSLSIGNQYFVEIAKFATLRLLWANVCRAYQYTPKKAVFIHAQNNTWNKSKADAYNNMLRVTTEAMSAVIGGCDSLTILPYNYNQTKVDSSSRADDFAERIARNVSIILKEESHLDKTLDALRGTYFLENMKESLAQKAWELFQTIEQAGGWEIYLKQGLVTQQITEVAQKRNTDFENKKLVLVGVNKFPNPKEPAPIVEKLF